VNDKVVEGVYESKMPLAFKAIVQLGCLVRPRKNKIPVGESARARVYKLDELEVKNEIIAKAA